MTQRGALCGVPTHCNTTCGGALVPPLRIEIRKYGIVQVVTPKRFTSIINKAYKYIRQAFTLDLDTGYSIGHTLTPCLC